MLTCPNILTFRSWQADTEAGENEKVVSLAASSIKHPFFFGRIVGSDYLCRHAPGISGCIFAIDVVERVFPRHLCLYFR